MGLQSGVEDLWCRVCRAMVKYVGFRVLGWAALSVILGSAEVSMVVLGF